MVRFILKLQARSHIGQTHLNDLNLLNVHDRISQLRLNHVFKIRTETSPVYLTEHFSQVNNIHRFRTRSNVHSNYFVPHVNSVSKTTFYFTAIQDWNSLPAYIKQQSNFLSFKRKVKQFLASRALNVEQSVFTCMP